MIVMRVGSLQGEPSVVCPESSLLKDTLTCLRRPLDTLWLTDKFCQLASTHRVVFENNGEAHWGCVQIELRVRFDVVLFPSLV